MKSQHAGPKRPGPGPYVGSRPEGRRRERIPAAGEAILTKIDQLEPQIGGLEALATQSVHGLRLVLDDIVVLKEEVSRLSAALDAEARESSRLRSELLNLKQRPSPGMGATHRRPDNIPPLPADLFDVIPDLGRRPRPVGPLAPQIATAAEYNGTTRGGKALAEYNTRGGKPALRQSSLRDPFAPSAPRRAITSQHVQSSPPTPLLNGQQTNRQQAARTYRQYPQTADGQDLLLQAAVVPRQTFVPIPPAPVRPSRSPTPNRSPTPPPAKRSAPHEKPAWVRNRLEVGSFF